MGTALLSSAYGWFAGLLVVMIVVTALFALILWIAIKPVKKDELDDSASAKKALGRRETELTIELLNNQHDAKERAELEKELREVKSAEKLVSELMPEDDTVGEKPAKNAKTAKVPVKVNARPAKPAEKSEDKVEKAPETEEKPKPAQPAKRAPKTNVKQDEKTDL